MLMYTCAYLKFVVMDRIEPTPYCVFGMIVVIKITLDLRSTQLKTTPCLKLACWMVAN